MLVIKYIVMYVIKLEAMNRTDNRFNFYDFVSLFNLFVIAWLLSAVISTGGQQVC